MEETDDEIMIEDNCPDNRKRLTKQERKNEVSEVLKNIENGTLESYKSSGISPAWAKFLKIRNAESKERIHYAQCMECKVLLTYKGHGGTSHMNRHICKMNEPTAETLPFRKLPADKIEEVQNILVRKVMKFCADDLSSYEAMCDSMNFVDLLQSFVSMGQNLGNVELKPIFPKSNAVRQEIVNFKVEKQREIYSKFQEACKREWCSASLQVQRIRSGALEKKLLIMRIQYLESDFSALTNKVILTTSFDEADTPEMFLGKLIKGFNNFGGHEKDLQSLKIVTSTESIFSKALDYNFLRKDCIPDIITNILDEAFDTSPKSETIEFLSTCNSIVRLMYDTEKYNLKLISDNGTWKSKFLMVQSINEKFKDVTTILKNDTQFNLQFNKTRAEEFVRFIEPFIEAFDDLSAVSCPTANKVILWWTVIESHLNTADQYSYEVKHIMYNAMDVFRNKFPLTMDYKIDCFLDPRYKCLKMLKDFERSEVIAEVGNLLESIVVEQDQQNVPVASTSTAPDAKKRRFADYETKKGDSKLVLPQKETKKSKKAKQMASRFKAYESNDTDLDQNDELTKYLKLSAMKSSLFQCELDILTKFWKSQHKHLPKLYKLAISRLHTPVCCGCVQQKCSSTTPDLSDDSLNDLFFIKDKF